MAISLVTSITASAGNELSVTYNPGTQAIAKSAEGHWHDIVNVGTTEETLSTFGGITTEGICMLRNLDDNNYVEVGVSTTAYLIKLLAGETYFFRLVPGVTIYWKANTAAVDVEIAIFEN